jgi:hypothetical protein
MNRAWLIGKPVPVERLEEPISAPVAGEHAAGSIPAMSRGSEADDDQRGVGLPEGGYRPRPIDLVPEAADLLARCLFAPRDQTRTFPALNDFPLQCFETASVHSSPTSNESRFGDNKV